MREPQIAITPPKRNPKLRLPPPKRNPKLRIGSAKRNPKLRMRGTPSCECSKVAFWQWVATKENLKLRMRGTPSCECSKVAFWQWVATKGNLKLRMSAAKTCARREPQIANSPAVREKLFRWPLRQSAAKRLSLSGCDEREPQVANRFKLLFEWKYLPGWPRGCCQLHRMGIGFSGMVQGPSSPENHPLTNREKFPAERQQRTAMRQLLRSWFRPPNITGWAVSWQDGRTVYRTTGRPTSRLSGICTLV